MTPPRYSLDSNILIYTAQGGDWRQALSVEMIGRAMQGHCVLTLQSLGEFYTASTRKGYATRAEARAQVRRWLELFPGVPATSSAECLATAMAASEAGRFGYWDAMLLATAGEAGCIAVISEDMAPGATLGTVRVVPAFQGDAASPEALALLG